MNILFRERAKQTKFLLLQHVTQLYARRFYHGSK